MSAEEYRLPEPIEITIKDHPPLPSFEFMDDLKSWLEAEATAWSGLKVGFRSIPSGGEVAHAVLRDNTALQHVQSWIANAPNPKVRNQGLNTLKNVLARYATGSLIYSKSAVGQRILEFAATDVETAVGIVMAYARPDALAAETANPLIKGHLALMFPSASASNALSTALADVGDEWVETLRERIGVAEEEARNQTAKSDMALRWLKRLARLQKRRERSYTEVLHGHQSTMQTMEKTFSEKMTLRAAERYWGSLRTILTRRARNNLYAFAGLIVGGGLALGLYFWCVVDWLSWHTNAPTTTAMLLPGLALGLPTLMWIWAIRIASVRYQENTHQADDAQARVAMLQSFIALEYKGKVSAEERLLVLEALFRPRAVTSSSETLPNPVAAAVIRALERKAVSSTH